MVGKNLTHSGIQTHAISFLAGLCLPRRAARTSVLKIFSKNLSDAS